MVQGYIFTYLLHESAYSHVVGLIYSLLGGMGGSCIDAHRIAVGPCSQSGERFMPMAETKLDLSNLQACFECCGR